MNEQIVLMVVVTAGLPAALLAYAVWRMRGLGGPQAELEPQAVAVILLAVPANGAALGELETLVKRSDFRAAETRRAAVRRLNTWLASRDRFPVCEGNCTLLPPSPSNRDTAGRRAERIAERLSERMERKSADRPADEASVSSDTALWCVLGIVAAVAVSAAEVIPAGNDGAAGMEGLTAAAESGAPMDAFYLFFAPAPGDPLSEHDARHMTADLHALARL